MFGKQDINIGMIVPTSKMALKVTCIQACGGDIDKAGKLYDYFVKGVSELPDFDPQRPSTLDQVRAAAGDIFGWLEQNGEKVSGLLQMIRGTAAPAAGAPPPGVPPIPGNL